MSLLKEKAEKFLMELGTTPELVSKLFLGNGASREVYAFEEEYVIKIPRYTLSPKLSFSLLESDTNQDGIIQCLKEIDVFSKCKEGLKYLLNPIIEYGYFGDIPYIIMPKVKTLDTEEEYWEVIDELTPKMKYDIDLFIRENDLYEDDICNNEGNVGLRNGEFCIIDYGLGPS